MTAENPQNFGINKPQMPLSVDRVVYHRGPIDYSPIAKSTDPWLVNPYQEPWQLLWLNPPREDRSVFIVSADGAGNLKKSIALAHHTPGSFSLFSTDKNDRLETPVNGVHVINSARFIIAMTGTNLFPSVALSQSVEGTPDDMQMYRELLQMMDRSSSILRALPYYVKPVKNIQNILFSNNEKKAITDLSRQRTASSQATFRNYPKGSVKR